jgi:hypothetical protein
VTINNMRLTHEDNHKENKEIEEQHLGVVQIDFEEELKLLEEWITKLKICEDMTKKISTYGMEDNNLMTEKENGKQRIVIEINKKFEGSTCNQKVPKEQMVQKEIYMMQATDHTYVEDGKGE